MSLVVEPPGDQAYVYVGEPPVTVRIIPPLVAHASLVIAPFIVMPDPVSDVTVKLLVEVHDLESVTVTV